VQAIIDQHTGAAFPAESKSIAMGQCETQAGTPNALSLSTSSVIWSFLTMNLVYTIFIQF